MDIHEAVKKQNEVVICRLVKNENTDLDERNKQGCTPLHVAAQQNNNKILKILLEHEADPFLGTEKEGNLALHFAVENNNLEAVNLLIAYSEFYPLPSWFNRYEEWCKMNKAKDRPIHVAIKKNFNNILHVLLEKKAKPNEFRYTDHKTPLDIAAELNKVDCISTLLKFKANINSYSQHLVPGDPFSITSITPLMYAAQNRSHEAVDLLIQKKADVTKIDEDGDNVLHKIVSNIEKFSDDSNIKLFKQFLNLKVDYTLKNNSRMTPQKILLKKPRSKSKQILELIDKYEIKKIKNL